MKFIVIALLAALCLMVGRVHSTFLCIPGLAGPNCRRACNLNPTGIACTNTCGIYPTLNFCPPAAAAAPPAAAAPAATPPATAPATGK